MWTRQSGAAATRGLLADDIEFDAIFALNDTLGLGVLRALGEAGVRIPEDVAVIGFDNIEEARFSVPSMSSVDPGRTEIARLAVDLLIERINEKGDRRPPRTVRPDFRVVRRESTGFSEEFENAQTPR
jgi:DNA-binding LacI/PurR family transcriptional regulator